MAQPLTISFATDVSKAQNEIARLAGSVAANAITMSRAAQDVSKSWDAASTSFVGLRQNAVLGAAGLVGMVVAFKAIEAGVKAASEQFEHYIALQKQARDTGVSAGFVDQFQRTAQQLHIEVEAADRILKELRGATKGGFIDRGSEAEGAIEDFKGYLPEGALERYQRSRDAGNQEGQNRQLLENVQHIQAVFGELAAQDFAGRFSTTLADGLRAGTIQIDAMLAKLDAVGQTPGINEQAKRAEDLTNRIADAKRELGTFLETAPALVEAGYAAKAAWAWILEDFLVGAKAANDFFVQVGKGVEVLGRLPGYLNSFKPGLTEAVGRENADIALRRGMTPGNIAAAQDASIRDVEAIRGRTGVPLPPPRPGRFPEPDARGPSTASEPTDPVETFVAQLEKSAAAVKAEAENFRKSNAEKATAIDLAKAYATAEENGSKVTDEQAARIRTAATEVANYKNKIAELTAAQTRAAETAKFFGSTLSEAISSAIVDGTKLTDVLKNVERSLLRSLINGAVNGTGPFALMPAAAGATGTASAGGLFGALLNSIPHFAEGGLAGPGLAMVGERGPELIRLNAPAMVTPNNQLASGGGMVVNYSPTYSIDARGAQAGVADQIVAGLRAYDQNLKRTLSSTIQQARLRGF